MAANQLLTHLIDIQSAGFAEQYERGYFERQDHSSLHHIGFLLGTYHGGVLEPSTGQLRPGVTTLAHLDHRDARRGYRAGREFYFVDAEPHQRRVTVSALLERIHESVTEMTRWKDADGTWFFSVGCLLGELSGLLFPMNEHERKIYIPQRQRLENARKRHKIAQERASQRAVLQRV